MSYIFCQCHPTFNPTERELDEAVEQYLIDRPEIARSWHVGSTGGGHGEPITARKMQALIRFWATHLSDGDRALGPASTPEPQEGS